MKVALVFGGRSSEHAVSVVSAGSVAAALREAGHEVIPMAIDRRGRWAGRDESTKVLEVGAERTEDVPGFSGRFRLDPELLSGAFDVAFPVLHGPFGEDGTIQGLFEMLDLPYVGCGVAASALCMDKARSKALAAYAGISTAPWFVIEKTQWPTDRDRFRAAALDLGPVVFVKPSRMGSSVGISRVTAATDFDRAVGEAFRFDGTVIVERGLDAREIEIAVLGNDTPRASVPGEVVPGGEFYSFDDKYVDDSCRLLAPAPLDGDIADHVRGLALDVFSLLGCQGMARVDFFLEKTTGELWFNEVNTIPGFTSISMYPRLWSLTGLGFSELVDELLRLACEMHGRR